MAPRILGRIGFELGTKTFLVTVDGIEQPIMPFCTRSSNRTLAAGVPSNERQCV